VRRKAKSSASKRQVAKKLSGKAESRLVTRCPHCGKDISLRLTAMAAHGDALPYKKCLNPNCAWLATVTRADKCVCGTSLTTVRQSDPNTGLDPLKKCPNIHCNQNAEQIPGGTCPACTGPLTIVT